MRSLLPILATLPLAIASTACTEVGDPALVIEQPLEVPSGPLTFAEHIEPILQDNGCIGCHGSGGGFGGLDVTTANAILEGGDGGPAIVPCDASSSWLWQRVRDCEMPASGGCLDDIEVDTIARWIDQGGRATFEAGVCPDPPLD